jgi:tetratricopeptide (TPR) repeat protein
VTPALDARQRVHHLFRLASTPVDHACRAARSEYAALPDLDPEDRASWDSYLVITNDLQTLLAYMTEVGVASSEPGTFRKLLMRVLRYLSAADQSELGLTLSTTVYGEWSGQLGETHPDVINVMERQAACYMELGDASASTALMRQVLTRRKAVFGDDEPRTLRAAANLGTSLNSLKDFHAALRLNQETVQHCRARLGPDHDTTLDAASILARSLSGLGEHEAALSIYRDVWTRRASTSGPDALETLDDASRVAVALATLGDYEAARAINEKLHSQYERALGASHPLTKTARERLTGNLRALGRGHEANITPSER